MTEEGKPRNLSRIIACAAGGIDTVAGDDPCTQ